MVLVRTEAEIREAYESGRRALARRVERETTMAAHAFDRLREVVHQPDVYFTTGAVLPIVVCNSTLQMTYPNDDGEETPHDPAAWHHPDLGQERSVYDEDRGYIRVRCCRWCGSVVPE